MSTKCILYAFYCYKGHQTCHKQMSKTIADEYLRITKQILKTYLSQRNKIKAMNQLTGPVFQCSCGIINWPQSEITKLNIKTRKLLTIHKMFCKNQCIPIMYLPRWEEESGLMELNQLHRVMSVRRAEYVKCSTNPQIQYENNHEHNKHEKVSRIHFARNFKKQVWIEDTAQENETATNTAPTIAKMIK